MAQKAGTPWKALLKRLHPESVAIMLQQTSAAEISKRLCSLFETSLYLLFLLSLPALVKPYPIRAVRLAIAWLDVNVTAIAAGTRL